MLMESGIIAPHGGHLVDRRTPEEDRRELAREACGKGHDRFAVIRHRRLGAGVIWSRR